MIAGITGFAKTGKDLSCLGVNKLLMGIKDFKGDFVFNRVAFADELKKDLEPLIRIFRPGMAEDVFKETARDLYVSYGKTMRLFDKDYWVSRAMPAISRYLTNRLNVLITDCRYVNEIEKILSLGGKVFRIIRPGFCAANEEEENSFSLIQKEFPEIWNNPIVNDETPEKLGEKLKWKLEINFKF